MGSTSLIYVIVDPTNGRFAFIGKTNQEGLSNVEKQLRPSVFFKRKGQLHKWLRKLYRQDNNTATLCVIRTVQDFENTEKALLESQDIYRSKGDPVIIIDNRSIKLTK